MRNFENHNLYTYGFSVPLHNENDIINFITMHKGTFCQSEKEKKIYDRIISESCIAFTSLDEFFEGYEGQMDGFSGITMAIINIMSRETGIRFEMNVGFEYPIIVFKNRAPWELNETEKNLTKEDLEKIFSRYMDELDIEMDIER